MIKESKKENNNLFFGGLPTKPEVNLLLEKYNNIKPGDEIQYSEIEELIDSEYGTSRFDTVTKKWRKILLKDHNLVVECNPGQSFYVAKDSERIRVASHKMHKARRQIIRGSHIAATTSTTHLSQADRRIRDHLSGISARLNLAMLTAPKS